MRQFLDLLYLLAAIISSPFWLLRMIRTGKIRTDWPARFGRTPPLPPKSGRRVLFHAVSVGEINAIRLLVDAIHRGDDPIEPIIATTTDTGFKRAQAVFGDRFTVVRYPFDFSFAVRRFLNATQPDLVVLIELELWPNFVSACARRHIGVCIVNGRLTERSARRYNRIRALVRPTFRRLAAIAVQNEAYARRFTALGAAPDRLRITGTMKWDTAQIADAVEGAEALAKAMGIDRSRPLIVAGSTAPDEHALLHEAVGDAAQLLCAPRKPEWCDRAADDLPGCARRTMNESGSSTGRFLLDTIGELRMAYALADLVVIGRSFGDLHGSDMMEPIALGKATIVGPAVSDFQDTVDVLLTGDGLIQTDRTTLKNTIAALLADPERRRALAENGRHVIRDHQGATRTHAAMIQELLTPAGAAP